MQQEYDIAVRWRAFPLHPETPREGQTLERLFAGTTVDVPRMLAHLHQVAESLGLPFGERTMTYNSRLAQELGLWAESRQCGDAFHAAAFHAYFAEGKNIARNDVLLDIAEKAGLSREEAANVLAERSFSGAVDRDWQRSREKGITAVPTFLLGGMMVTGAKPYRDLAGFIEAAGAKTRPT